VYRWFLVSFSAFHSSSNVVTLLRRAHAAFAGSLLPSVTHTLHCVPSSTPRSLPVDRFVAAYNSYHCAPPFQAPTPGASGVRQCPWVGRTSEPPLENHLNHLSRYKYAEVFKGHPCAPSVNMLPVILREKLRLYRVFRVWEIAPPSGKWRVSLQERPSSMYIYSTLYRKRDTDTQRLAHVHARVLAPHTPSCTP
jgi:hypothetical protein